MTPSKLGGSGRKQGTYNYRLRHNAETIARLEELFKQCAYPDEIRRRQISEELGLEINQVKFWFQNKKTQVKTINERIDNNVLRVENERMQSENLKMRETLRNVFCVPCGGGALGGAEERELSLQILKAENFLLTKEHERISTLLANLSKSNPMLLAALPSLHDTSRGSLLNQTTVGVPAPDKNIPSVSQGIPILDKYIPTPDQLNAAVNQSIPAATPTPTLRQDNPIFTPNIPAVTTSSIDQNIPVLNEESPPLISTLDYNIPALVTALDQNISTLISTHDKNNNIPIVQQEIPEPNHGVISPSRTPNLDQDISPLDLELEAVIKILNNDKLPQATMSESEDTENERMPQIAKTAMEELMKLLSMNEPFWFRSLLDGKFVLQRDSYQRIFRRRNCLSRPHARIESSKDSRVVKMSGTQLVEMFLNSDKWVDLFPTIVKKAQTIQVLESGSIGNRNGALLLMNAETHILSPLVPIREFHFLRFCKQLDVGVWAIGDVSFDSSKNKTDSRTWRLPSGCLIQEMTQASCWVTWVEHMEVDDKIQTHQLFREVIIGKNAYGAERWVMTLERMCERFASASAETIPSYEAGGVIRLPEGRKSVMHLAHRMVKGFCGTLDMQDNTNFSHLTRMNNGGVRVSVRLNTTEPGVPKGMIIGAATSFWLPHSPQSVFDYLIDTKERAKWDVLCDGSAGHEIQHISTGSNPGNCISIMRPFIPRENNIVILQESYADALGSMLVYAPFDTELMNLAMRGEDTTLMPVLPSGFSISWDGQSDVPQGKSEGSLVTLMFQILASSPSRMSIVDSEFVGSVNTLVTTTVDKIKDALNVPI